MLCSYFHPDLEREQMTSSKPLSHVIYTVTDLPYQTHRITYCCVYGFTFTAYKLIKIISTFKSMHEQMCDSSYIFEISHFC